MSEPVNTESTPPPSSSITRVPEHLMHKNRLQEYTQRASKPLPIYQTINEGSQHAPKFRSTVLVDGAAYTSPNTFSHRKTAEQDVAKLALECISQKIKDEGCPLPLIREGRGFFMQGIRNSCLIGVPEHMMHKNCLQEYTQRASIPLPIYQTINEGSQHAPKFRSNVLVDGAAYTSPNTFSHRKTAEQDVAKLALECISQKIKDEGCPLPLIREDTVFCKSILNEFAVKMNLEKPTYNTIQPEGLLPVFISSLVFNGVTYTGDAGKNKKEAEQLAARAVILSILGNSGPGTLLSEIIKSKVKLYAALHRVVPVGVNAGNIQNTGNSPVISLIKGKEVEVAVVTDNMPTTAFSEASSGQLINHPVVPPAFHELRAPKPEPASEAIPSIVFVPSVFEQTSGAESSSAKRHNRKSKKKSNKKSRVDAHYFWRTRLMKITGRRLWSLFQIKSRLLKRREKRRIKDAKTGGPAVAVTDVGSIPTPPLDRGP